MILALYLTRMFALRFVAALLALAALLQLVDLMDRSDEIVARGLGAAGMVRYALLRLPLVAVPVVPIAALVAAVLTFTALAWRGEVSAMRASGLALARLVAWLLPAGLVAAALGFALADWVAPRAESGFVRWWAESDPAPPRARRIWFRAGMDVVGARIIDQGRRLEEVEIVRRDPTGALTAIVIAPAAEWRDGRWWLADASLQVPGATAIGFAAVEWPAAVVPDNLMELTRREPVLSTATMAAILAGRWIGREAPDIYRLRLARAFAQPVAPIVMILLATPVAGGLRRSGGIAAGMAVGLAAGLSYLLLDGILAALGEAGLVPVTMASWLAHAVFASIGGAMLLHAEG